MTGHIINSLLLERSGRLVVIDEGRHTFDVRDRKEAGRHGTVDGGERHSLVRGGAPREATGSQRGGRRVAGDEEADVGRDRRGGRVDTRVLAGLR